MAWQGVIPIPPFLANGAPVVHMNTNEKPYTDPFGAKIRAATWGLDLPFRAFERGFLLFSPATVRPDKMARARRQCDFQKWLRLVLDLETHFR